MRSGPRDGEGFCGRGFWGFWTAVVEGGTAMLPRRNSLAATLCASALLGSMTLPMYANACTRVVYLDDRFHETCVVEQMIGWRIPCFAIGQTRSGHGRLAASSRIDDDRRR